MDVGPDLPEQGENGQDERQPSDKRHLLHRSALPSEAGNRRRPELALPPRWPKDPERVVGHRWQLGCSWFHSSRTTSSERPRRWPAAPLGGVSCPQRGKGTSSPQRGVGLSGGPRAPPAEGGKWLVVFPAYQLLVVEEPPREQETEGARMPEGVERDELALRVMIAAGIEAQATL
jgi:hypothetical protein